MPVNTIPYQPASNQLMAAYRPVVLRVTASATGGDPIPPFVVADIYLDDIYYKSIFRTTPESSTDTDSLWKFDISSALQERLYADLAPISNFDVLASPHVGAKVFVRFRASERDANSLTVEEATRPVQGTSLTDPVAGTGTQSNTFYVINAALQHEDNQNLADHLDAFKQGTWDTDAYPLSHRPRTRYRFCPGDSDHFGAIFVGDCLTVDVHLHYRLKGEISFTELISDPDIFECVPIAYSLLITGNQVLVTLAEDLAAGQSALVQYRKQPELAWTNAGVFTATEFSFNVQGDDLAGDYDIQIFRYCTSCRPSTGTVDEFTLDGTVVSLAWRPITPFCVLTEGDPIYIEIERRNVVSDQTFFPNQATPMARTDFETYDLWVKFFSDAAHLTPLSVNTLLRIYVLNTQTITETQGVNTYHRIAEAVALYTISPFNVTEMALAIGQQQITQVFNYSSPGGPQVSQVQTLHTLEPFPTHLIDAGNNGLKGWVTLEQYNTDTLAPTGTTKPNIDSDPDYVAPVEDLVTCPIGPPMTNVTYGSELDVGKVEFLWPGDVEYANAVGNTYIGGYVDVVTLVNNTNINLTVRVRTLSAGNTTGFCKVRVQWVDINSVAQNSEFNVANNIETTLPTVFRNITAVVISNF